MNKTKRFPHHWQIVKLGNYLSETGNTSIEPFKYPNEQFESYSVPSYETDKPEIVLGKEIQSNKILVQEETVLLSKINPRINRVWIVGNHSNLKKIASTEWICFPKNDDFDPIFLRYLLMENNFRKFLVQNISGVGGSLMRVNPSVIKNYPIPLPPLAEQKQIVAILQEADALRRKKKEILEKSNRLASALFLEMFGDPVRNEKGWTKVFLGNVTDLITDGKHGDCTNKENSGYYFISAKDIHDGIIDYSNARQILQKDFEEVHRRTNLMPGDLVIVNTGATIGKMAIATEDLRTQKTTFQKSVAVVKVKLDYLNIFYLKFLFGLSLKDLVRSSSGSAQQNLLLSQMRKIPLILPPIPLQNDFAKKVEAIEETTKQIESSLQKTEKLYDSLLQNAFTGDLTESWRKRSPELKEVA